MAPFNGSSPEMAALGKFFRQEGLYTFVRWNYFFTNPVMGKKPPAGEDPKRENYKTKADIVAFVKKSVADGAAAIQSKGEKGLNSTVPYGHQEARVLDIAYSLIEHSGEHYGQLVVYYRLSGLVPPESRPKK